MSRVDCRTSSMVSGRRPVEGGRCRRRACLGGKRDEVVAFWWTPTDRR